MQIDALQFGWTVTRETLLTPAQAAVLAAAKAQKLAAEALQRHTCDDSTCVHDVQYIGACTRTEEAVTTLRAQEGT